MGGDRFSDHFEASRPRLHALAYRMLGSNEDAEDAVQETWLRIDSAGSTEVENLGGWFTTIVARICLDKLRARRSRRESPSSVLGPDEESNGPDTPGPEQETLMAESVEAALLVVLDRLGPAERVAFVLHDVFAVPFPEIAEIVGRSPAACRQLATSARARVQKSPSRAIPRDEHDRVVRAFAAASQAGDFQALIGVLDPDVVLRSDGGGRVSAARNPVAGADRVARFLFGILGRRDGREVLEQNTSDGLGFALWDEGRIVSVTTLEVSGGRITDVRIMMNPDKLSLWN
jgi:RNA polymerase sigma factor (sigma-70 family)